jgi:hypothetical protein
MLRLRSSVKKELAVWQLSKSKQACRLHVDGMNETCWAATTEKERSTSANTDDE